LVIPLIPETKQLLFIQEEERDKEDNQEDPLRQPKPQGELPPPSYIWDFSVLSLVPQA